MDGAERAFIENLLQIHRSHLQVLEQQAATFGVMAPPFVVTQITEYQQKIAELENRLRPALAQPKALPRHNLPRRDYERFIGRQQEQAEVRRLLGPHNRAFVISIEGIGGIGKSSLALECAYSFVDQSAQLPEDRGLDRAHAHARRRARRAGSLAAGRAAALRRVLRDRGRAGASA